MSTITSSTEVRTAADLAAYVDHLSKTVVYAGDVEPVGPVGVITAPKRTRRSSAEVAAEKALIERIERAIESSPVAVERAILLLAANQTASELAAGVTVVENGVGFSGCDADLGAWLYRVIRENEGRGMAEGCRLRGKALDLGRKVARRYARTQLLTAAKAKAAATATA